MCLDIKPDNILLDHNGVLKLVDFGAAKKLENRTMKDQSKKSLAGTPSYIAPEVITGQTKGSQFGAQDVWSFGCVILELVTGKRPWSHLDNEWAIMYHIGVTNKHPPLPELRPVSEDPEASTAGTMTAEGLEFLKKCFLTAAQRPNATELLQDVFLKDIQERIEEYRQKSPPGAPLYPNPWSGVTGFSASGTGNAVNSPAFSPGSNKNTLGIGFGGSYFGSSIASNFSTSQNYYGHNSIMSPPGVSSVPSPRAPGTMDQHAQGFATRLRTNPKNLDSLKLSTAAVQPVTAAKPPQ